MAAAVGACLALCHANWQQNCSCAVSASVLTVYCNWVWSIVWPMPASHCNKELLSDADSSSLNVQLAHERDHFVKNLHHTNAGIGISSFLNKQKPEYE